MSKPISSKPETSHTSDSAKRLNILKNESIDFGKSIPAILKETYFKKSRLVPLMTKLDVRSLREAIQDIGQALNILQRNLNRGIREGFVPQLDNIQKALIDLHMFVASRYCRCKRK